jgi:tetratricopeptide (TPR) repeat protein
MANVPDEIDRLFAEGEELADVEQYADALCRFQAAWDLLPEPKDEEQMAVQILAAIADCRFFLEEWGACREAVQRAFRCGAELDNPFFRLRLGQSLYELGDEREAGNWLVPVYLMEGRKPFEADDPKYLEFFRGKLRPPRGGWPEGW